MPKIIVTKEDWIKLGFNFFSEKGEAGIVVEKMAKKLKVNKSSFYWYFKTKQEFIEEVVKYWVFSETEQIINTNQTKRNAIDKWNEFLNIAFKNDPYLEFIYFLKRYALKHKEIQKTIDKIDNRRLSFVADLLEELGFSKENSNIKSSIFYNYLIGYHEMIRHKKQEGNYLETVKQEINHFIKITE